MEMVVVQSQEAFGPFSPGANGRSTAYSGDVMTSIMLMLRNIYLEYLGVQCENYMGYHLDVRNKQFT